jgi:hypothetical protein
MGGAEEHGLGSEGNPFLAGGENSNLSVMGAEAEPMASAVMRSTRRINSFAARRENVSNKIRRGSIGLLGEAQDQLPTQRGPVISRQPRQHAHQECQRCQGKCTGQNVVD